MARWRGLFTLVNLANLTNGLPAPPQTPLLLSLNASMLYLGTAAGAIVGGAATACLGLAQLAWAGIPFVAAALVITAASHTSSLPAPSRA